MALRAVTVSPMEVKASQYYFAAPAVAVAVATDAI